jgi:hypothetical protein
MRQVKSKLISFLVLCLAITGLQAQNKLYIKELAGVQTSFTLSAVRKLTFAADHMTVHKTDGFTTVYGISQIRYFSFTDGSSGISLPEKMENSDFVLYPNPVTDELRISYKSLYNNNLQIDVLDMLGRTATQYNVSCSPGTGIAEINLSELPKGLYTCRLQCGNIINFVKFAKN